jgi:hypothetical protein
MTYLLKNGLGYHQLFASLAGKTRVGFEPGDFGVASQAAPVQNPASVIYNSIMETVNPNRKSEFYAPVSYLCLQNDYFAKSGITIEQFAEAAKYIQANANTSVGNPVPSVLVPTKAEVNGDANGDGKVDLADQFVWKQEYFSRVGSRADFNRNGIVDFGDLDIWKKAYFY